MKNNLLTEIKHIKHLMGLNEADNQECEDQLEKDGYVVYSPNEQKDNLSACAGKQKIKCVKDWMDENNIDSNTITIDSYKGICYLAYRSDDYLQLGSQETPNITWIFWENGDLSHINTFSVAQKPDSSKPNENWGQYQYKGTFECDGNELKSVNMKYIGVYAVDNYSELVKNKEFKVVDQNGAEISKVSQLLTTNDTLDSGDF